MAGKKILLVEDDYVNMRLVKHILESEGYTMLKATTGQEALEQVAVDLPDLILMDVQLPDMDGMMVVKTLKQNPRNQDIPILALTAYAMKGDRERIMQMGCNQYISKPIEIKDFIRTVRHYLEGEE